MIFDDAKENIQPLATGRDASILQASISALSPQELLEQRREYEDAIRAYDGIDPLEPWYNYIRWIEQSFPSGGKESGLMQVVSKCVRRFESEEGYYQDRRMIKLFIKLLSNQKEPLECYQQLYNAGIGTMVADFYIAWAYCYDSFGQTRKADETFRRGIECRAEPLDDLKEAHQHFGFAIAQRTLYKDDEDALEMANRQIEERRTALSSLRAYKGRSVKGEIGSIRTGAAVKNIKPGTIQVGIDRSGPSSSRSNAHVAVLSDENVNPCIENENSKIITEKPESVQENQSAAAVRSVVDKVRNQENEREPGPWNKAHDKKNKKNLIRQSKCVNDLGFSIHEDNDDDDISLEFGKGFEKIIIPESECNYDKPFKYPENFVRKNRPNPEWILPITTECQPDPNTIPRYNKCMLYPRSNREFQSEELRGYLYFKRLGIQNSFTQRYESVWGNGINVPLRLYPNFARQSNKQTYDELDKFYVPPKVDGKIKVPLKKLYNEENKEEYQNEEIINPHSRCTGNDTVMTVEDMDETVCTSSNNEQVQRRKSFFPSRRSLAIRSVLETKSVCSTIDETVENQTPTTKTPENSAGKIEEHSKTVESLEDIPHKKQKEEKSPVNPPTFELEERNVEEAKKPNQSASSANSENNDFYFKTPALPVKQTKQSPEEKVAMPQITFEIFVDENPQPVAGGGLFEVDETCTTQAFNNFIKFQLASTPKAPQKTSQKRQFGVLLDVQTPSDILPTHTQAPNLNSPTSPEGQIELPLNICTPVPIRKQLSTILETSEHGTTHSTGTSTKSTNGSQESDVADGAASTFVAPQAVIKTQLATTNDVIGPMRDINLTSPNNKLQENVQQKFVIYIDDDTETWSQLTKTTNGVTPAVSAIPATAGNFERMVQREDTASGYISVNAPMMPFLDENTETIKKIALVQPVFSEDQTVTTNKIHDSILSSDLPATTSTQHTWLKGSQLEITQPKTIENISNKATTTIPKSKYHIEESDDSFAFFSKTPVKPMKPPIEEFSFDMFSKPKDQLVLPKSSCTEKANSELELMKIFESEMMSGVLEIQTGVKDTISQQQQQQNSKTKNTGAIHQNSVLPDLSVMEISQPTGAIPKNASITNSTKNRKDSKIPIHFSASKPKKIDIEKSFNMSDNNSFIPETQEINKLSQQRTIIKPNNNNSNNQSSSMLSISKNDTCRSLNLKEPSFNNEGTQNKNATERRAFNKSPKINNAKPFPIFEINSESETFSTGLNMIKNSTMLLASSSKSNANNKSKRDQTLQNFLKIPTGRVQKTTSPHQHQLMNLDREQEMSIYFKHTPRTPQIKIHENSWPDNENDENDRSYMYQEVDLNETHQRIQNMCNDRHVNPFSVDLLNSFLDSIVFENYLKSLKNTMLVGKAPRLNLNTVFNINKNEFKITKLIGEGSYGIVYRGLEKKTGKEFAFKQERPPNYWEFYISLEVQSRITKEELLPAYMKIDYALIGNNASIFVSPFSSHGSIINVCNKIKKHTHKNVDELVVMHLACELLDIIDHLHAAGIIHADIKADNFLLMRKLEYNSSQPSLQLIDFGVSIDMKYFKENQTFTYVHNDNAFKCVEMRENREWSYQLDLYGLAGVIHVMIFGQFMDIEKRSGAYSVWMPKTHMPRYIKKLLWEPIFRTLLNVRDCKQMPNLQHLRSLLKQQMADEERFVIRRIAEFNLALDS